MAADRPVTLDEWETAARAVLPPGVFHYIAGGAGAERTLAANEAAFDGWTIWPSMLRGSGDPNPSTSVLGTPFAFPVGIAPWAFQGHVHDDGEPGTARAAAALGVPMCVSSTVLDGLEGVAASGAALWWQLYIWRDRDATGDLLRRAEAAGYRALVWTVDVPALGRRHRDTRSGFTLPVGPAGSAQEFEPALSWDDLAWIRAQAPSLPVIVKGILRPDDALAAIDHGADAIVVSNHGGRQLDRAPAALDALPGVVDAVAGRVPVLVDGGVRDGADALIAIALGAAAVLVARPTAWGLAVGGQSGVEEVLAFLRDGLISAMANAGCTTVGDITPALVRPAGPRRGPSATLLPMPGVDMHTHSVRSDGTNTVAQNVALALDRGVAGIAITDHDTTAGLDEGVQAAAGTDLRIVPGIEFSAEHDGASLHVLAYWIDPADQELVAELRRLSDTRFRRGELMVENLQALGYDVSFERVRAIAGDELVARPHIAQAMVEAGIVETEKDAFDRFISDGGPAYVPKHALAPLDALALIRGAGGVCVLAHPAMWKGNGSVPDALIDEMAAGGMGGLEVDHPDHDPVQRAHYRALAERLDLVPTGASDCHGARYDYRLGAETTPLELVDELQARTPG